MTLRQNVIQSKVITYSSAHMVHKKAILREKKMQIRLDKFEDSLIRKFAALNKMRVSQYARHALISFITSEAKTLGIDIDRAKGKK